VNLTWSLSSSSFGSLSPAAFKTEIEFTAGNVSGNVTLRVTADLNGKSVNGTAVITISPVNCSCEKSTQSYLLTVIVIAIAVAAFLIIFFLFRKRFIKAPADPILPPI
jgi:phosphotransferase system  glucose/maltose/N-acetylglucosamine-specific IIC component